MNARDALFLLAALGLLVGCGGDDSSDDSSSGVATSEQLTAALADSRAGDRIRLTGDRYEGSFRVPAGVTVEGNGALVQAGGLAAFHLDGGTAFATKLSDVTIENDGVGITATGGGEVVIERVDLRVDSGAGIVVEQIDRLRMAEVNSEGPVTEDTLGDIGSTIDPQNMAVAGLIVSSAEVVMDDVSIAGFAGFGAIFQQCNGRWSRGSIQRFVGTGMLVEEGEVQLEDVTIENGMKGREIGFAINVTGAVATKGARLTTSRTEIRSIDGIGMLHDGAVGMHEDLDVSDNDFVGLWVQNTDDMDEMSLMVTGNSALTDNRGSALLLREAANVMVDGALLGTTDTRPTLTGFGDTADVGDGLQCTGVSGEVTIRNTMIMDNERVGVLVDGTDAAAPLQPTVENVAVLGSAGEYGVLGQNGDFSSLAGLFEVAPDLAARDEAARDGSVVLSVAGKITTLPTINRKLLGDDGLIGEDGSIGNFVIGSAGVE